MKLLEKTISSKSVFKGKIINVKQDMVELPDGCKAEREFVEHPGGVCVVALTDMDEFLFVRQYRYPYSHIVTELPAGKLDKNETPAECGKRELLEETGVIANSFEPIGVIFPSPGYTNELLYLFFATGLSFGKSQTDSDEFLSLERIKVQDAVNMCIEGEIKDAKTIIGVLRAAKRIGKLG